ncbi:MAG: protein-glutamate O-methyltransferase [Deltaproteobacteria bacterium]|nr:protein-glutamate O-methyltransferase [Deltaproteobacteria bacterium]
MQFKKISNIVYRECGINLQSGKEALVRARLTKRLRVLKIEGFKEYVKYLESHNGGKELGLLVDVMTTNKTSFFREVAHFDFLCEKILPKLTKKRMRFWSAACSSGEEPFSLAMLLLENIPNIRSKDIKILATDISPTILGKARKAVYQEGAFQDLPTGFLRKYFVEIQNGGSRAYQVSNDVRRMVRIAKLNLMESWPVKGPFNVIFCRNVMIYFDRLTQEKLVNRFWELLEPGGYLFVGHSEGLSGVKHKFQYVQPATYVR